MRAELRALPPAAWILFAGTFVNRFGSFVFVFLTLYLVGQGYSPAQAGLGVAGYGAGALAAALAGGVLADRLGRRNAIALSMAGSASAMLALWRAESLGAILPLVVVAGFFAELYRPAAGALIADLVPAGRRVPAYAAYRLAINAGFAAGPASGGLIAKESFGWLFVGDAITSVVFGVVALVALPHGGRTARGEEPRFALLRSVRRDRALVALLVAAAISSFVYMQTSTAVPLHVREAGFSVGVFGALMSVNGLAIIVFELPLTSVTRRLPIRPLLATALLLVGAGFAATGVAESIPALAATVVVWTLGEMAWGPNATAYVADLAPPGLQGRYQGALGFAYAVALVPAPVAGAALYGWHPPVLWTLCLALGAIAALLVLTLGRPTADAADTVGAWTSSRV